MSETGENISLKMGANFAASLNVGDICNRVPTAQGKQGKWQKKIPVRENTGNLEVLPKHRKHREFGLLKF